VAICPHSLRLKKNNRLLRSAPIAKQADLTRSAAAHHGGRRAVPEQFAFNARKFRIRRTHRLFQIIQAVKTKG
jgi:hypothetical protein